APESHTGRIGHRHRHDLVNPSVGREANDTTAAPLRIPDAAGIIDARTVRQAWLTIKPAQLAPVADSTGFRIIVDRPHRFRGRVGEIQRSAVGTETDTVGAGDLIEQLGYATVRVEADHSRDVCA